MPEATQTGAVTRRGLISVATASAVILGLVARGQAQQGDTSLPFLPASDPLNETQDAQCALAQAIKAAAVDAKQMVELLQAAATRLAMAVSEITALLSGADAEELAKQTLPIPKRFAEKIKTILGATPDAPGLGEIETQADYLLALRVAADQAAGILAAIIERQTSRDRQDAPLAEWDNETLRLFELVMAMQLLNASAVGFNT
ncbi:hypothetical protein [Paracoccus aminovorans]|uniref:hypothetical protein n=1 Tax=Paracoccus aminovorans TaxID=34004 RepID=UPI002B26277B|nr:hypothetical protein [Paracoccus aminovorans]